MIPVFYLKMVACLVLLIPVAGCGGKSRNTIHFRLPVGFRGFFVVKATDTPCQECVIREKNGDVTYIVPQNGIVEVESINLFEQWHRTTAEDTEKKPMLTPSGYELELPTCPALWDLDGGEKDVWFFVGTAEEWQLAKKISGLKRRAGPLADQLPAEKENK
jgi:hypothetical protein